ncbi:MAG TPA: DUF58 domain-containing protein, partial [Ornithinibacter sp.]|nr:DUF58 domain-containing protein [Ornithinibacter sp.]
MAITWRAVVLALLGLAPVALWPQPATVRWWVLLVVVLVALDVLLASRPDVLRIVRGEPAQVRLGESTSTTLWVTNTSDRGVRGILRDAWPPSAGAADAVHELTVPPHERVRLTTRLVPTRRGDRVADRVTVRLRGPLGLAARQRSLEVPGSMRALHAFPARKHLPSRLAVLRQLDGRAAVRTRGQGTEFDSLRDYVEGDDVRSIDWRATARRQNLVVRTWQPEQHRRVVIVLDTSRTSAGRIGDAPRLDAAMDAALLLTALAGHAHDRVQVIAGDRVVHTRVTGADRARLLHDTISTLAPVESRLVEADWSALATEVMRLGTHRALVVLLTALESSAVEEGLLPVLPALAAHHRVVVASVSDPALARMRASRSSTGEVYDAAAAERTVALRRRTASALEQLGVDVIDA